jgi:hypothetical protein
MREEMQAERVGTRLVVRQRSISKPLAPCNWKHSRAVLARPKVTLPMLQVAYCGECNARKRAWAQRFA